MKKLMTFITLSAAAVSIYAQANEQPHQAHMNMPMSTDSAMQQELMQGMSQMHQDMMAAAQYKDPDVAFAAGMLPHHIGAVKMAEVELKYGKDPEMRKLAENIINAQQAEIEQMQKWLKVHNKNKITPKKCGKLTALFNRISLLLLFVALLALQRTYFLLSLEALQCYPHQILLIEQSQIAPTLRVLRPLLLRQLFQRLQTNLLSHHLDHQSILISHPYAMPTQLND